jgi:ABC-type uncharacterized transport system ATPase subunit
MGVLLELNRITKRYPGVIANDRVSLSIEEGEIRGIIGENGAGKTTLAEVIYGLRRPDSGEIIINGERKKHLTPKEAISSGIGLIRQQRMLIPEMSVLENIVLGAEPVRKWQVDMKQAKRQAEKLFFLSGFSSDLEKLVFLLTPGEKQLVELTKLLFRKVNFLILDEPSSSLAPTEVAPFLSLIKRLKEEGKTVIFISHRLPEVLEVADRITVMRRGKVVTTIKREKADEAHLSSLIMGGGKTSLLKKKEKPAAGEVMLTLSQVMVTGGGSRKLLDNVSLSLCRGEVLGVASVAGNGERELALTVAGFLKPEKGEIELEGRNINKLSPNEIKALGVAFIPGERDEEGLISGFSLAENLILGYHRLPAYYRFPFLHLKSAFPRLRRFSSLFGIVPLDLSLPVSVLSGGNRQRAIIARELSHKPRLIIAENPTQGLDIAGARLVRKFISAERERGVSVILISPEMEELIHLSDRIIVLRRGRLVSELRAGEASHNLLGRLMIGGSDDVAC